MADNNTPATLVEAVVHNEGCDLHYWRQGQGPTLIIFVPGGGGNGDQYFPLMALLTDHGGFTTATFDRRQTSASQLVPAGSPQKRLSPPQQARDVRAVIQALGGFERAVVFGNSSGAIFALQFAHDFPDLVDRVIAHEAPLTALLPDASKITEWFLQLYERYETEGMMPAAMQFASELLGYDDEGMPPPKPPVPGNLRNFWENEFLVLLGYVPNLFRIKENGTSVGVMRGERSRDAFYARTTDEMARILDCPHFMVPGHHQGYEPEADKFLPRFLEMLDVLEEKKKAGGK
ncbi:Alpha/Beta hydrolase protein [Chaetomium sp. MPI-SDFR-AT-0129]|nr:Alpha/Beta hydrolase protein [Chaetomium sp. MPI-SDFR-AT-0129]